MGQFDVITIAAMALEVAVSECQEATTTQQYKEALEDFDDASAKFSDAVRHRMELAHEREMNG